MSSLFNYPQTREGFEDSSGGMKISFFIYNNLFNCGQTAVVVGEMFAYIIIWKFGVSKIFLFFFKDLNI